MDIKLHYVEKGAGYPLILLHGNGEDSRYFKHQISYFSRHYRVIAIDSRGHGASPRGEGAFTLERFAEDLKGFLDARGIKQAIVLGFSDGGNTALLFTLKYQDYVKALILNGANLHPRGIKKRYQIPICVSYGLLLLLAGINHKAKKSKELYELMVRQPNIPHYLLRRIKVPVLVIAGTKDMIKTAHSRYMKQGFCNSRLVIMKGNHFIASKKADAFNREVEKFLAERVSIPG